MKNVRINDNTDWTSLKLKHEHDDMIVFEHRNIQPIDGINLTTTFAQQHSIDSATDNYSNLILTEQVKINDILKIQLPTSKYPEQFTTSLLANGFPSTNNSSAYLYVLEELQPTPSRQYTMGQRVDPQSNGIGTWTYEQDTNDNSIYFTVTLHDEEYASVNHHDNYTNAYMTVSGDPADNSFEVFFYQQDSTIDTEQQRFNYVINHDSGSILFYKIINDKQYYLYPNVDTIPGFIGTIESSQVESRGLPNRCVWRFIKYDRNTSSQQMLNNWVSYQTLDNQNNLNVNNTKSYFDITNNYLFNSQFHNINNDEMNVNITQLKNQLTPTGRSNRNNPFPNMRDCDHREYDKIFSTTGDLNFGYNAYEMEITLEPDLVTYFNSPQDMYPYEKINVNDSGLIENGAIGGDTPVTSDKIFKKAADYKYNTPNGLPSDEESGVWLCSWLRSNVSTDWNDNAEFKPNMIVNYDGKVYRSLVLNKNKQPDIYSDFWELTNQPTSVWVDRYYNPEKFSAVEALEYQGQYNTYKSKFETVVENYNAQNEYIFDKRSDLTFEPGCLYGYHRVGREHIQTMITNLDTHTTHNGITPVYTQSREPWNNIYEDLTFTGEQYLQTNTPANVTNSDFTISFDMSMDDWSQPIGSQILGNYTNEGVGIFNKQHITPYITLIDDQHVYVYGTDMNQVFSIDVQDVPVCVARSTGNENMTIHTSLSSITYDMKGMLTETNITSEVVTYIDQNLNFTITTNDPGLPNDYIVLESDKDAEKTITEIISGYNDLYPTHQLTVTGNTQAVPPIDIIINTTRPEGRIIHANLDENNKYLLDEYHNVYKYNPDNETRDLLNVVYPFETIGSDKHAEDMNLTTPLFTTSNKIFVQPTQNGATQYRIDCDQYTIDNDDQVWFTKQNKVFKYTLSEKQGINASWVGNVRLITGFDSPLLLLATNNYDGDLGNTIEIDTDGTSTIKALVDAWNTANSNRTVNIVEGDVNMIPVAGLSLRLSGGADRGDSITTRAIEASDNINSIKSTHDNDILVLYGMTKLVKMDNLRNITKQIDLTSHADIETQQYDQCCMDIVTEFNNQNHFDNYMLVLLRSDATQQQTSLVKIDYDLNITNVETVELPVSIDLNKQQNITNFETLKQVCKDTIHDNCLTFQLRYQSYFDTDKTYVKKIKQNVQDLTPGYHHFSYSFNSNNSNISLFVDGELRDAVSSDDSASGAAYKYSKTIHTPMLLGVEPFFNNITLSEHLNKDNYCFARGFSMKNYRVFNEYLNFQKIKMLAREGKQIQPITLTLPTGKRNYIEHVTKFYKHRKPGKKSTNFDISIVNATLSSTDIQDNLTENIRQSITPVIPVNSNINNINWVT